MPEQADIGLIGLGVMGENLALNIERHGFPIAVFNRHSEKVQQFLDGSASGKKVTGCFDEKSLVGSIKRPRRIILLVKAGEATDSTIGKIKPYLEPGDIVIDGGNSHYIDTRRRVEALAAESIYLIGSGVSGGEEGALWGPSLMRGGDFKAYEYVKPIWEAIAAKVDDGPCVAYLGTDGAGHYVKMVHNGIEYGDMQLIAEAYDILVRLLGLKAKQISEIFQSWNKGLLNSFLVDITAKILLVVDPETKRPLVELILDKAGQKGTGKWTAEAAQELGVPIPTIDAAVSARMLSALKEERVHASKIISGPKASGLNEQPNELIVALADALYASKICSYAQGMALIKAGSDFYKWGIKLSECARIWKGGCIIRAQFLNDIVQAYKKCPDLPNLLLDEKLGSFLSQAQGRWRQVVTAAQRSGIPVPALSASLAYFDGYRSACLPQNLTQAQRDFFGAHTYQRVDKPELGFVHTNWQDLLTPQNN